MLCLQKATLSSNQLMRGGSLLPSQGRKGSQFVLLGSPHTLDEEARGGGQVSGVPSRHIITGRAWSGLCKREGQHMYDPGVAVQRRCQHLKGGREHTHTESFGLLFYLLL